MPGGTLKRSEVPKGSSSVALPGHKKHRSTGTLQILLCTPYRIKGQTDMKYYSSSAW